MGFKFQIDKHGTYTEYLRVEGNFRRIVKALPTKRPMDEPFNGVRFINEQGEVVRDVAFPQKAYIIEGTRFFKNPTMHSTIWAYDQEEGVVYASSKGSPIAKLKMKVKAMTNLGRVMLVEPHNGKKVYALFEHLGKILKEETHLKTVSGTYPSRLCRRGLSTDCTGAEERIEGVWDDWGVRMYFGADVILSVEVFSKDSVVIKSTKIGADNA